MIICLTGLDGSGKTAHLMSIMKRLQGRGLRCKYAHLHGAVFRFLSLPFLLLCKKLGYPEEANHPVAYSNNAIASVWPWIFFLDFLTFFLVMNFPDYLRKNVIFLFDRYVYDVLVDLIVATGDPRFHKKTVAKLFLRFFPTPDITLLLDIDVRSSLERKLQQENHSLKYLQTRRFLYQKLAKELEIPVIDATKTIDEVSENIIKEAQRNGINII